jgi:hypothetical protein
MRDPIGPIPSPAVPTPHALRFWRPGSLPPPLPPAFEAAPPVTGIDRRQAERAAALDDSDHRQDRIVDTHEPVVEMILGLQSRRGWTLCRPLTLCRAGLLVRRADLLDPRVADVVPLLAPRRSLLGLVSGCLLAPRLLEDLAHWGSHRRPAAVPVTLIVPSTRARSGDPPALTVAGTLAPLTDPSRDVLAIALAPDEHARLRPHLIAPPP